ncbi:hypothetical protein [Sphingomonas sp. NIC1]|uniref:hypothetical protein n=1 Tax=Sphingomonas sp. NIC1 TaxID=1961362 RepID=UPI0007C0E2A3|nr:hypothetical protein [Sphingomonas sp. NIC1]ANC88516.1 hypothetical protein A7E77_16025 [Sphingomonas sp. NIC1]
MSGIFQQARSFERHSGELVVNGRRKHERFAAARQTVAESTNFRDLSTLHRGALAIIRPIFVLSATERRGWGSQVA